MMDSSSRSSIRSDSSKLPPCLRLLHERRKSNTQASASSSVVSSSSTTGSSLSKSRSSHRRRQDSVDDFDLLPPAFRTCLSRQAARQSILRDVSATLAPSTGEDCDSPVHIKKGFVPPSPVRRIQRNLSLKRATWRKVAEHGRKDRLTNQVLKLVALRATHERTTSNATNDNDKKIPSPPPTR